MVQYSKLITTMDGLNPQISPKLYAITHLDLALASYLPVPL